MSRLLIYESKLAVVDVFHLVLFVAVYEAVNLSCLAAIQKQLSMMKNGEGGLSMFLGLNGTKEELGLKADNFWIFAENNLDELYVFCCLVLFHFTFAYDTYQGV